MNNYVTIKEIAERWGISTRRVQKMCADGMIPGVIKFGNAWAIPKDTEKPVDGRITTGQYVNWRKKNTAEKDKQ